MNHREPPQLRQGTRRVLRCFSLLLLPAFGLKMAHSLPRSRPGPGWVIEPQSPEPVPYLPALGALPLRFQHAPPPPDLVTRPAAAAPPVPPLTPTESSVAQANLAAMQSTTRVHLPLEVPTERNTPAEPPTPPKPIPQAILPDDTRPPVRAEDFLPFFQIPGSGKAPGDVTVITRLPLAAPSTGQLPPSSATYTQTPK